MVLKVVNIDPQGLIRPSKGSNEVTKWPGDQLLLTSIVLSIFSYCGLFYHAFQAKSTQIYFDMHTFFVLVTVGLGHGVYRKLYTLIGGQRAEKFENH